MAQEYFCQTISLPTWPVSLALLHLAGGVFQRSMEVGSWSGSASPVL